MLSFMYHDEKEMIKAQQGLIELGLHCLQFADYVDFDLREYYYNVLCQIYKRSELDLGQIGFSNQDEAV